MPVPEKKKVANGQPAEKESGLARRIGLVIVVAVAYFATGTLGLRFNAVSGFATLLWPPTGIAIAALLFIGYGAWPAIAFGAFATNLVNGAPAAVALGIAAGNTLEALIGAYLLNRAKFSPRLDRVSDVLKFIVYAAVLSTLASAAVGVASLVAGGIVAPEGVAPTLTAWWVGDALGDLVFGAALLAVVSHGRIELRLRGSGEAFGLMAAVLGVGGFIFFGPLPSSHVVYLVFLPLLWAAMRFEQIGTVLAALAMMMMAVWATATGMGPFSGPDLSVNLIFLQLFIGVVVTTKLIVAATQSERRVALEEVRGFNRDLEGQVMKRTLQLSRSNEELQRSKESLAERHALLQSILRGIGEGVIAVDTAGNPIVFNPAAANIVGIPMQESPSRLERMFAMFPSYYADGKTEVPMEDRPLTRALRGETVENENLLVKSAAYPEGVLVSCTASPIVDEQGRRIGGVVVFRELPR